MTKSMRVGLTGGIGSGKSTVADMFSMLGAPVIDADIIAHDLVRPGKPALQAIVDTFGPGALDNNGTLNREYIRTLAFHNSEYRQKLESILHPLVYDMINREYKGIQYAYCIIVVPLLVETNAMKQFDRILVVDMPEELQLKRAGERDSENSEQIGKIIQIQASRSNRLKVADDIITNDGDIACLQEQVNRLHKLFLDIASSMNTCSGQITEDL